MSRTDRTKPLWVRQIEHGPRAVHDHRHGACDLPARPSRTDAGTRCHWEDPGAVVARDGCCAACQIRGCIRERQAMNRTANRKTRYEGRRLTRRHTTGEEHG